MDISSWSYERSLIPGKDTPYCGVDEAGRGPLAGRVYAAAVILPDNAPELDFFKDLNDSKKISEKKRAAVAEKIKEYAKAYCVAWADVGEIEEMNILNAALTAMQRAIDGLSVKAEFALIDGNRKTGIKIPCETVVKGDAKCPSVSAASILAKTERDKYCIEYLDKNFPEYGFAVHKGYGTKAHYAAVDKYGLCEEHRASFFKKYFEEKDGKTQ